MDNLALSSNAFNLQTTAPQNSAAQGAEWIDQNAVICTLYAADCVKKILGYQTTLGGLAAWQGAAPELINGRRADDLIFTDAEGKEHRRADIMTATEAASRQYSAEAKGLRGKDPLLSSYAAKAKNAAAAILKAYEKAALAASQGGQSLEAFKASEGYRQQKNALRLVDYRLSTSAAGLTREEVTALAKSLEPRNDDEPYCAEMLALWNGCLDLDIDGVFGLLNGRPASEQLARALPTLGIAGLISCQASPSGCGLTPVYFIGREKAPRNRGELKRLYSSIYADLATYCAALGYKLPPMDAAFNGATHLVNTPRYCSPFPIYGNPAQWRIEAPDLSEVASLAAPASAGFGVRRRKAAKQAEGSGIADKLLALHDKPFERRPRNAQEAAAMQAARPAVYYNETATRVEPWRPSSIPLPPRLSMPIEHNPAQRIAGEGVFALRSLCPITAPRFADIEKERRKEDAIKAAENARKLADLRRQLAASSEAASRYESRQRRAFETAKMENLNMLAAAKQGTRDKTAADCFYKIGRAAKRYGLPEGAPADVLQLGAQAVEYIGLFLDSNNPKWRQNCENEIRRLFNKGYKEASVEALNERPAPSLITIKSGAAPRLRVIEGGASASATPDPSASATPDPSASASSEVAKLAAPASSDAAKSAKTIEHAAKSAKAESLQEAGDLIFEEIKQSAFLVGDDWFWRPRGAVTFEKVSLKAFKIELCQAINRLNLQIIGKKGEFERYEQTRGKLEDLELQVARAASEGGRRAKELRFDEIIFKGKPCFEIYLTADGQAVKFDRVGRAAEVITDAATLSDCVSTSVHLATAPATDAEGRLLTFDKLAPSDRVKALFDFFSEGDPRRLHRLLYIAGRLIARRLGFDAANDHSIAVLYGEKGAGKTALSYIIDAVRGGAEVSSRRAKQTALDASNRFGAAELYTTANVYIDDVTFKKPNISVLLNMTSEEHEVETKGKDSKKVRCFPNFAILSNNEPPVEGNAAALARRFCPFSFTRALPHELAAEWIEASRKDKDFQGKFIAVACAEYFRQLGGAYVETADDCALQAQVDLLTPIEADLKAFFRRSDMAISEHILRGMISKTEGRQMESWEFKGLAQKVRSIFGLNAVKYDAKNHALFMITTNARFAELITEAADRRACGEELRLIDLEAEKGAAEGASPAPPAANQEEQLSFIPTPPPLDSLPATPPAPEPRKIATEAASASASAGKVATPPAKETKAPASEPPRIITATEAPRPSDIGAYVAAFNEKLKEAAKGSGWRPNCKPASMKSTFSMDLAQYAKQIKAEVSDLERRAELEGLVSTALGFALSKD